MPRLRVRQGDVTTFEGDAIINPANEQLQLGVGVAGAVRQAGGPSIQEACDRLAPVRLGDAVITTAGKLNVRYVIHAVVMGETGVTPDAIRRATDASLRVAVDHDVARLAAPILGTGSGRVPLDEAARMMLDAITASSHATDLDVIVLYGYRPEDADLLERLVG